jgi:hypothetical protein
LRQNPRNWVPEFQQWGNVILIYLKLLRLISLVMTLSEGMWFEFWSHNQYHTFRWKFLSNEAPSRINSPADKRGVLNRSHKAQFAIAYAAGLTTPPFCQIET